MRTFVLIFVGLTLSACGTAYEGTALKSWDRMASRQADEALEDYKNNVTSANDRLLRLMDEGILLRVVGRFEESNQKFLEAADIIEDAGYISISEQATTLLTNEKQIFYQGEDFEKTLVHVYLALNFMSLKDWDSALVEARRVNEILYQMIFEGKRPYKQNQFAQYLSSLIYEKTGEFNSAYIDLKKINETNPELIMRHRFLQLDLLRLSYRLRFMDDFEVYQKKFGSELAQQAKLIEDKNWAQVVLLFESGQSPQKYSSREKHSKQAKGGSTLEVLIPVAYYRERPALIDRASLKVGNYEAKTWVMNDIETTAIQHLKDRMGRAIAKALLTAGVKAGIATGVGKATDSTELGLLAGLALFAMSEADTRSWLLLPAELQVARIFVPAGKHAIQISYMTQTGAARSEESIGEITLQPKEILFLQRRSFY